MRNGVDAAYDESTLILSEKMIMRALNDLRIMEGDGRMEFFELKEKIEQEAFLRENKQIIEGYLKKVESNMNSVVMVAPVSSIFESPDSDYVILISKPLYLRRVSEEHSICKNSSYAFQPSAFCYGSGFFVKEKEDHTKVVATAAHILVKPGLEIEKIRFIHGIQINKPGDFAHNIVVHKSQVYKPIRMDNPLPHSDYELFSNSSDWAFVAVKPAYEQFSQPRILPSVVSIQATPVQENTHLYAIGHGLGLPLKISFDGEIMSFASRNISTGMKGKTFFESKLTLLGGNSGSPVFSAENHELVGLYMRGVKKLHLTENYKCLRVKNEGDPFEGQECLCVHDGTNFYERLKTI